MLRMPHLPSNCGKGSGKRAVQRGSKQESPVLIDVAVNLARYTELV